MFAESEHSGNARAKKLSRGGFGSGANALAALLHYEDHSGAEDGDVAIVALEGVDRRFVSGCNGVESLAGLHRVVEHARLRRAICFFFGFGRLTSRNLGAGGRRGLAVAGWLGGSG